MAETTETKAVGTVEVRHRGRRSQIAIYFLKFLRMFIYQNEWKVLPMAALIAGLVGMVMKGGLFLGMEATLMGSFSLAMVCIWNGCFNSIQAICRERDVIKREHRSGMHISSYIIAHMMYQALLCLMQTGITIFVTRLVGMRYDLCVPLFTHWTLVDFGISMFLITYAADMMALWISTLAHSTTTAMTIMPFILIFQLVFSGGMLSLPAWSSALKAVTISAPGVNVLCAQGDYNHRPLVALWNYVQGMGDKEISVDITGGQILDLLGPDSSLAEGLRAQEISASVTVGQVLDYLDDESNPMVQELRGMELGGPTTLGTFMDLLDKNSEIGVAMAGIPGEMTLTLGEVFEFMDDIGLLEDLYQQELDVKMTLGELLDLAKKSGMLDQYRDRAMTVSMTCGQLIDLVMSDERANDLRGQSFTLKTTVAELQSKIGVETVRVLLQDRAGEGSVKAEYEHSLENVLLCWGRLLLFILLFAALSTVTLEFIDKDKR